MKRIGVVSDSHGNIMNLQNAVLAMGEVDAIFHLGDYVRDAKKINVWSKVPVYWIRGNCDMGDSEGVELAKIKIAGKTIMACHGHLFGVKQDLAPLLCRGMEEKVDAVLFGHTHHTFIGEEEGILLLNPGALIGGHYSDAPSYAIVTIDRDEIAGEIHSLNQ
ncbi:metallophosphoesterase family protein [Pseudoramibacter alactolyticus]|nr:metallophosphoesterase [Pseudoramibacter alactolyticus]